MKLPIWHQEKLNQLSFPLCRESYTKLTRELTCLSGPLTTGLKHILNKSHQKQFFKEPIVFFCLFVLLPKQISILLSSNPPGENKSLSIVFKSRLIQDH